MERLLELKAFCLDFGVANAEFCIDDEIWAELPIFVDVLGMFTEKMDFLQKEDITLTDVCGVWLELDSPLKNMANIKLASVLREKLSLRKAEMKIFDNDVTISAMFLDLRFHFLLTSEEKQRGKNHSIYLWQKQSSRKYNAEPAPMILDTEEPSNDNNNENVLENIMRDLESSQQNATATKLKNDSIDEEIQKFCQNPRAEATVNMNMKWESLKFSFPILYELAKTIMAVAPTEVSCERNFSTLDFILNKRRNRLSDHNLETILFIKLNQSLFYESFENGEFTFD